MKAAWKKSASRTCAIITVESSNPMSAWKRRLDMKYQTMMPPTIVVAVKKIALPVVNIAAGISVA